MTITLQYKEVPRRPNPMATINPLKRGSGRVVDLQDRVDKLLASHAWQKIMKAWGDQGKMVDISRLPKVAMVTLGDLLIDEDIQRGLDEKHCANRIAEPTVFDPALLQTLQCIKNSKAQFISIDGQHTATVIAGLITAGLIPKTVNWRQFEFPVQYIETDNLAFARRAFSILNGKGKKKQSQYQQLRNSVFIVRIDKDTSDEDDVIVERKVAIAEEHDCYPIEVDSSFDKYPGTFSNVAVFQTLTDIELETACSWHNRFFHYESVHVSLFFIFKDLIRKTAGAKLEFFPGEMMTDLAALIQTLFGNLSQYQESVTEAHRKWWRTRYGEEKHVWDDDAYAVGLMQLYKKFGGEEKIALTLTDRFDGLVDFFDNDILSLANG